jgi:small subunit ribosomal protein S20
LSKVSGADAGDADAELEEAPVHAVATIDAAATAVRTTVRIRIQAFLPRASGPALVDFSARMANIKSQKKRNIQNEKRHQRNIAAKSSLKTTTKKVQAAVTSGDAEAAVTSQREAARALDKAASKGVLHKKTAARKKSRLAKATNAVSASA